MTRGPEPADRSPEPADREWIVLCDAQSGAHLTVEPYPVLPGTPIGIDRGDFEIVVAKSRLDAAMAAADERERELQRRLSEREDDDYLAAMREDAAKLDRAEAQVRALTEALREAREALEFCAKGNIALVTEDDGMVAREALADLPVPVEAEPEEEKR